MVSRDVARMIDHSILHPTMTDEDLAAQCALALQHHVATVCVKPYHTAMAAALVKGSDVGVCAVIGFPHGNSTTAIKAAETRQVLADGATEVDMVINVGKALQGDWEYVARDVEAVHTECRHAGALLKVILETDFLAADEQKIRACQICSEAGVAFVKTSTGFGFVRGRDGRYAYAGATEHDVKLFRQHVAAGVRIKAAGGIRTLDELLRLTEAGAARIGTTATTSLLQEAVQRFGA